jgi:hypothetical protein
VTSFAATTLRIAPEAVSGAARRSWEPITIPISPSCSTCRESSGSTIGSPLPITDDGGLRKISGSFGNSLPISRACST